MWRTSGGREGIVVVVDGAVVANTFVVDMGVSDWMGEMSVLPWNES